MAMRNPQDIAANWAARLGQSGPKIQAGIDSVTVAPGVAAARQKEVWASNTAAAKDKWATNVGKVSLAEWQAAAKDKGVARIASGATAAQGKFADFMTQLLPHIDRTVSSLPARGNLEQNIARSAQFARGMAAFKRN